MATWEDVRRIALALPETGEKLSWGTPQWHVKGKGFVWDRPLRKSDLAALGVEDQEGPVLGVRVADEGVKHALVADDPDIYFTIPHFDGYAAVLVRLDRIGVPELEEAITEAWLLKAPRKLAQAYLDGR
ncbi:MmcQ/YjbR family DNA-binding protein [Kutzneria sp. CA-103260]|uniref:MmcQ/YjbR family DNA-binding protein n=1 Tax=Kutzneria sp. CA-103260 TaxID=2802641 RepID=UPI001BA53430|nr:MmcQ/YjbR family DNA-binding protein [Kutzneria sp. CA-103260]QUQ62933.1 MmcQ/YjbR family DNA-binding protein [Kutzneria sp. CA-103260]